MRKITKRILIFSSLAFIMVLALTHKYVYASLFARYFSDGVWNWCPQNVNNLQITKLQVVTVSPNDYKNYCLVPYKKMTTTNQNLFPILKSRNADGELGFVEANQDLSIFRIDGQYMQSPILRYHINQALK